MKRETSPRLAQVARVQFRQHLDVIVAMALAFLSFLIYLRTLAPDVVDADGANCNSRRGISLSFIPPAIRSTLSSADCSSI